MSNPFTTKMPDDLTGNIRLRKGLFGKMVVQVEYRGELHWPIQCEVDQLVFWRDAKMKDFEKLPDIRLTTTLKTKLESVTITGTITT